MTLIALPPPPSSWKRNALIAGLSLLALVGAFLGGRYSKPVRVEERVRVETKTVTVTEWKDRVVEKVVQGPVRIVTRTVERAGEKVTEQTEERGPVVADRSENTEGSTASKADRSAESIKVTENGRPGWRASVAAGWNPSSLRLDPSVYDLRLERRLIGTLWVGAFARTDRTGGLSLAMEW